MKSADIEVGKTYLYKRDSYSPRKVVRVERILTQDERMALAKEKGERRTFGRTSYTETVEVTSLVSVTTGYSGGKKLEHLPEVQEWVRPATILEPFTIEQAEAEVAESNTELAESERKARTTVARFTAALKGSGLPVPEVRAPGYRAKTYTVAYPYWREEDYHRLVELLEGQR